MTQAYREVRLPASLCSEAERKYAERFGSVEDFLVHVLYQLVREDVLEMDRTDQAVVAARLKDLGYI
jgi:hypothetical protein